MLDLVSWLIVIPFVVTGVGMAIGLVIGLFGLFFKPRNQIGRDE